MRISHSAIVLLALSTVLSATLNASTIYDFHIFNNPAYNNTDLGFSMEVIDMGFDPGSQKDMVSFKFTNAGLIDSSITHVYFDDGSLLTLRDIFTSTGASFSQGASPGELPDAQLLDPDFETTGDFLADADAAGGKEANGLNQPGEWLEILFELQANQTYNDVITQLNTGGSPTQTNLRVGLKIISLPDGSSAAAVNTTPEPATLTLLAIGTLLLKRRKA